MISSMMPGVVPQSTGPAGEAKGTAAADEDRSALGKRFEQMLWSEMLTHAGLEKSFTLGGGEAASAFSRYVVEAIAEDLAENHPLGLARQVDAIAGSQNPEQAKKNGAVT